MGPREEDGFAARIGHHARLTRTFDHEAVQAFAAVVGDHNPIHVDEAAAAKSMLRRPVVHGMLCASLFSTIFGVRAPGCIYWSQDLKFRRPVFVGDPVTATIEVTGAHWRRKILFCSTTCTTFDNRHAITGCATVLVPKLLPPPSPSGATAEGAGPGEDHA